MPSQFSPQILQTLMAFFSSTSIPSPTPSKDGSFTLVFERSGTLIFNPSASGKSLVMSLSRPPSQRHSAVYEAFFALAGFDPTNGTFLHTGIDREENLFFSVVLDEAKFDLPTLERTMRALFEMQRNF